MESKEGLHPIIKTHQQKYYQMNKGRHLNLTKTIIL